MIAIFSQPDNNSPDTLRLDNNTTRFGELLSQGESWQRKRSLSTSSKNCTFKDLLWMTVNIPGLSSRAMACELHTVQKMIFTASCILNASPGPIPGAPLKSPMVSLTKPNPLYN